MPFPSLCKGTVRAFSPRLWEYKLSWRCFVVILSAVQRQDCKLAMSTCWKSFHETKFLLHSSNLMNSKRCTQAFGLDKLDSRGLTKTCLLNSSGMWATSLHIPKLFIFCGCQQGSHVPGYPAPRQHEYNKSSQLPIYGHEAKI